MNTLLDVISRQKTPPNSVASVPCLFPGRGPAAILGRVIAIVIDPVDAHARIRLWPHVGIKGGEGLPPFTDPNAARKVVLGAFMGGLTSLPHVHPRPKFGGLRHAVRAMMRRCTRPRITPTTPRLTRSQVVLQDSRFLPAITSTRPTAVMSLRHDFGEDDQSTETLTDQTHEFTHNG